MATIDYDQAVQICAEHFLDVLSRDPAGAGTAIYDPQSDETFLVGSKSPMTEDELRKDPGFMVRSARIDNKVREGSLEACRRMRKSKKRVPPEIVDWLVALQLGEIEAPASKRSKTDVLDGLIYHAVAALVVIGEIRATRNQERGKDSSLPVKRSACDVVAGAFEKVRSEAIPQLPGSYDHVKRIWNKVRKDYPFEPDQYADFISTAPQGIWEKLMSAKRQHASAN